MKEKVTKLKSVKGVDRLKKQKVHFFEHKMVKTLRTIASIEVAIGMILFILFSNVSMNMSENWGCIFADGFFIGGIGTFSAGVIFQLMFIAGCRKTI